MTNVGRTTTLSYASSTKYLCSSTRWNPSSGFAWDLGTSASGLRRLNAIQMPIAAISTARPTRLYSRECESSGAAPCVIRSADSPTTGSSQCSSAAVGCNGTNAGRLSQPPTALSTPSTIKGPVITQGASARCGRSFSPVRLGPWKV